MEDEEDKQFAPQTDKVGGYDLANLFGGDTFIAGKNKTSTLSFKIEDIYNVDSNEILKLKFFNNLIMRIMKFNDTENRASATFDLIDEQKKEIVLNSGQTFVGGLGIARIFHEINFLTQWEIPIFEKLCRSFVLGDPAAVRVLIKDYHVEISEKSEWRIRHKLGL